MTVRMTLLFSLAVSTSAFAADPPAGGTVGVSGTTGVGVTPMDDMNRPKANETLTDAQIYAVLDAENNNWLDSARLVAGSSNADLAKFSKTYSADATTARTSGQDWLKKAKLQTATSQLSTQMTTNGKTDLSALGTVKGPDLDRRYLDTEIAADQQMLTVIDTQLSVQAKSPDLRKMIQDRRAKIQARLDEAKRIQGSLPANASVNVNLNAATRPGTNYP
jgi:predicted outer membrane protein